MTKTGALWTCSLVLTGAIPSGRDEATLLSVCDWIRADLALLPTPKETPGASCCLASEAFDSVPEFKIAAGLFQLDMGLKEMIYRGKLFVKPITLLQILFFI